MKKLILTLAVLVCAGQLFAQNQPSQLSDQQKAMRIFIPSRMSC